MTGGRPGLVRWLLYSYGRRLPARYSQWVLYDLTCRTWFVRVEIRSLVQCLPALALLAFPAPASVLAMMLGIVAFGMLFYGMAFALEIRDRKLYQHGFVPELVLPQDSDDEDDQ